LFSSLCCIHVALGQKLLIGYFGGLWKYDPRGANFPLPPGITDPNELLELEMGPIIPNYDVVIQAFIDGSNYRDGQIVDPPGVKAARDGVNGKPGLRTLANRNGVKLMIAMGGGGAGRFIPDGSPTALVNALYTYVTQYGYDGIDIDEENDVPVQTYVNFMDALATRFKGSNPNLLVSNAIGPLSCCFQSRAMCKVAAKMDWVFLMLYDGLQNSAAFDIASTDSNIIWQDTPGQKYCGIEPYDSQEHGLIGNVAKGGCQFTDFALYLKWPANKLIFGMPMYSTNIKAWMQIKYNNEGLLQDDQKQLLSQYTQSGWINGPQDITARINKVMNPSQSVLGVSLDDSGWQSKILTCAKRGNYSGATILGAGFWQMAHEDYVHHELSSAARAAVNSINAMLAVED